MGTVHIARTLAIDYDTVWDSLRRDASSILTGIEFEVEVAGVHVSKPVIVNVLGFNDAGEPFSACTVPFEVHASDHEGWFPTLTATLVASRRADGTGVALEGAYHVPAGALGAMADALVLRSVAEQSVSAFFGDVLDRLTTHVSRVGEMDGVPWS